MREPVKCLQKTLRVSGLCNFLVLLCSHTQALRAHMSAAKHAVVRAASLSTEHSVHAALDLLAPALSLRGSARICCQPSYSGNPKSQTLPCSVVLGSSRPLSAAAWGLGDKGSRSYSVLRVTAVKGDERQRRGAGRVSLSSFFLSPFAAHLPGW